MYSGDSGLFFFGFLLFLGFLYVLGKFVDYIIARIKRNG